MKVITQLGGALLDLLFPRRCLICHGVSDGDICPDCLSRLEVRGGVAALRDGNYFDWCAAPLVYGGDVRDAILRFKFRGNRSAAVGFGKLVADCARTSLTALRAVDVATWVPVSRERLRERGYDQARLLAVSCARELNVACEPLLVKTRNNLPQSSLGTLEERVNNTRGVFAALPNAAIKGRNVLLIDDIITTGSTLSECARTLLMAGAESVLCATLADARGGKIETE